MRRALLVLVLIAAVVTPSCSVRKYTIKQMGGALANSSGTFSSDNDPELVRAAVPFSLKLMEALLEQTPNDPNLLLAAASGFTQYAYGFVQMDAYEMASHDRAVAAALRDRAAKLYLRARDYGLRGLSIKHPNFRAELKANPKQAVQQLTTKQVPVIYWTAIAWAGAFSVSRDMFMLPQIPQFEALIRRALELNESYGDGALHTFMIAFDMVSPTVHGDRIALAKQEYERTLELSKGHQAGPYVSYAENVLAKGADRAAYEAVLRQALKVDVNAEPQHRLENLLMQRRARWLLSQKQP